MRSSRSPNRGKSSLWLCENSRTLGVGLGACRPRFNLSPTRGGVISPACGSPTSPILEAVPPVWSPQSRPSGKIGKRQRARSGLRPAHPIHARVRTVQLADGGLAQQRARHLHLEPRHALHAVAASTAPHRAGRADGPAQPLAVAARAAAVRHTRRRRPQDELGAHPHDGGDEPHEVQPHRDRQVRCTRTNQAPLVLAQVSQGAGWGDRRGNGCRRSRVSLGLLSYHGFLPLVVAVGTARLTKPMSTARRRVGDGPSRFWSASMSLCVTYDSMTTASTAWTWRAAARLRRRSRPRTWRR